jgi:uncharacterized delta-60 repeat protein
MDSKRSAISALAAAAALTLVAAVPAAEAAPGQLDPSFGDGGVVLSHPAGEGVDGLAVQPDGKVLIVDTDQRVQRLLPNGAPDPSFGTGGAAGPAVVPGFSAHALALQPDGRIVLAGYDSALDFAVARLMPDGKLDPDFDGDSGTGNGVVHTPLTPLTDFAGSVTVDDLGRIVAAGATGSHDVAVVRYLPDGKLDKSFAGDGSVVEITPQFDSASALAVQADGILVAGVSDSDSFVARYGTQGASDSGFGQSGRRVVDVDAWENVGGLAVQSGGRILLAVQSGNANGPSPGRLIGVTAGGDVDQSFGDSGRVALDGEIESVAAGPDDKVVVTGYGNLGGTSTFMLARKNADGSPDASFAGGAPLFTDVLQGENSYAQQAAFAPDGKVVVAGYAYSTPLSYNRAVVARYLVDPDPSGGTGSGPGGPPQPAPLALTGLKLTNRSFAVARRSTAAVGRAQAAGAPKRGTAFVYSLNRPARVTIRIKRLRSRVKPVKLVRTSPAGRVRHRALRAGRYRATVTATDSTGGRTAPQVVKFRIVRAR